MQRKFVILDVVCRFLNNLIYQLILFIDEVNFDLNL